MPKCYLKQIKIDLIKEKEGKKPDYFGMLDDNAVYTIIQIEYACNKM